MKPKLLVCENVKRCDENFGCRHREPHPDTCATKDMVCIRGIKVGNEGNCKEISFLPSLFYAVRNLFKRKTNEFIGSQG